MPQPPGPPQRHAGPRPRRWLDDAHADILARRIRAWLAMHDIPPSELARAVATNRYALSRSLHGSRKFPADLAISICHYTGMTITGKTVTYNPARARPKDQPRGNSADTTAAQCTCGFTELADEKMTDHLLLVFETPDSTGNDGQVHEERQLRHCACGLATATSQELDAHLLAAFTPRDATGNDGRKHAPAPQEPATP
ncbi:MAG TPA: hypothetical protein VMU95_05300 [Trebonia sp.]|nr:hypothetical protein [Trebonia sp.]